MQTQNYKPHIFSLFALFVCGNAIIVSPFHSSQSSLFTLAIIAVLSVVFILCTTVIIKLSLKNNIAFFIVGLLFCAFALYGAVTSLYDYVNFVVLIQLPQTSVVLIALAAIATIVVFCISANSAIYKYSLLVAVFSVIMVILIFTGGIKHFDVSQIKPILNTTDFLTNAPKIFLRYFSAISAAVLFVFLTKNTGTKAMISGALIGFLAIVVCFAQSVLTLGATNNLPFSYIKAVSVISSGSLFTRLDGLVYFVFFATAITKAAVCAKTIVLTIKNLKRSF